MGIYGNLSIEELETLYNNFNITHIPSVLVETGTYQGDSIEAVHALFECIYTIEIDEQRYVKAKDRLKDLTHLNFLHGDSLSLLPVVLDKCKSLYSLWFLDAHGQGDVKVPLLEEIDIIIKGVEIDVPLLFVIDDVRLFDKHWDWNGVNINTITNIITKSRTIEDINVYKDRLCIKVI